MRVLSTLAIVLIATAASAAPSVPARTGKAKAPEAAVQPAPSAPADTAEQSSSTPYNYNTDGRRDPFQSLTSTGSGAKSAPRPTTAGIAGIRVDELSVRGIMQSRERLVAMVQGPDNRTYLIHQGDKLADGVVKSITPQGLVLVQDVSDPRAKDKTREVRKPLRTPEDEKE